MIAGKSLAVSVLFILSQSALKAFNSHSFIKEIFFSQMELLSLLVEGFLMNLGWRFRGRREFFMKLVSFASTSSEIDFVFKLKTFMYFTLSSPK